MNKNIRIDDKIYRRHCLYQKQYYNAIDTLIKTNKSDISLPLINLIYQFIENDLKSFIVEYDLHPGSAKSLQISHHDIKILVEEELFLGFFNKHEKFKKIYREYKNEILYFYSLLGKYTFLNSRYPVKSNKQEISTSIKNVKIDLIIKHWDNYIKCLTKVHFVLSINYLYQAIIYEKKVYNSDIETLVFNYVKKNLKIKKINSYDNLNFNFILDIIINKEDKEYIGYLIDILKYRDKETI